MLASKTPSPSPLGEGGEGQFHPLQACVKLMNHFVVSMGSRVLDKLSVELESSEQHES